MAVYADARPFTLYECPAMKAFLFQLEPAYKPPSAHALANGLLDGIYTETKDQVDAELRASTQCNIVFDESEDIRHHRIINLCICVASGACFYGEFVRNDSGPPFSNTLFVQHPFRRSDLATVARA
jgi:hypothetical protein